jgi:hypothetical protein
VAELCSRIGDEIEFGMPTSLKAADGAMRMSVNDDARRTKQLKEKDSCC